MNDFSYIKVIEFISSWKKSLFTLADNCSTIIAFNEKVSKYIHEIVTPMGFLKEAVRYFAFVDLLPLETELNLFKFMPKTARTANLTLEKWLLAKIQ